ncbi:hypothetical protein TEA_009414 [Camellia sinensis var. sinensis]|uniref:E2 ubiquitin-conjugating enzyme n=1 Tax=Camellia sinensis var. sinensis TaxID=542762 RepID=A0A4S4EYX7_CAMSN|nr:hypothetical protein TEA_009414 [Camellia sinensis var. sinensis]
MASPSQASLLLQKQLKDLCKNPVDGFSAGLVDESNLFEWSVTIIGPPDTLYEGGFFNAIMTFPSNYPNSPPTVRFTSDVWHPNVYPDGKVCISILHPPGDDPNGYELASERWMPVHTVESIVLSIISMLSSPNDESPANVEAASEENKGCKEEERGDSGREGAMGLAMVMVLPNGWANGLKNSGIDPSRATWVKLLIELGSILNKEVVNPTQPNPIQLSISAISPNLRGRGG